MVILMDSYSLSEGLFLKNYLGTVSGVPRSRTMAHIGPQSSYAYGKKTHFLENGMFNCARITYEPNVNKENEAESKEQQKNGIVKKNENNRVGLTKVVQMENNEEKEKKKERKWTLGGFFRKKDKKDADDSSNNSDEDNKKGFLSRRKYKRDRRKINSRTNTNGFDIVILQQKDGAKSEEISMEQLWSGDPKRMQPNNEPVRFINRHPDGCNINNALQPAKHYSKNSYHSRTNGGSENTEGKKNRKEILARAEAKRDMLRDDSSSEEYDSYQSNSSLNRHNVDCRRSRRIDRHRRLSKDEDQSDIRMIKSDFEGDARLPPNCRWISKAYCADSSDLEASKLNLINYSGTPSPCRSPRTRQKLHHAKVQKSFPTSTFPPGVHYQQLRSGPLDSSLFNFDKENQPLISYRNQSFRDNRNSDSNLPKSVNSSGKRNRKTLMDYEQFINSCGFEKEKSLSYDQIIYRASCFENEPKLRKMNQQLNLKKEMRYDEMITKGGKKVDIYNRSPQISENPHNKVVENRNDSALSQQSGIFPQQPTQIVRRSPSGISLRENSSNFHFNRSNSFNHLPFVNGYCSKKDISQPKPPKFNTYCNLLPTEFMPQKPLLQETPSVIRYYADQNPRSRNPIHITCNSALCEQPYLSDSQMVMKPAQTVRNSASDFWKLKDQEFMNQLKNPENLLKLPPTQNSPRQDKSRSNSPKLNGVINPASKLSGNATNENEKKSVENNIKKTLKEECNSTAVNRLPPEPPVRKLSKEEVLARLQKCENLKNQENELRRSLKNETKTHSNNLDEALFELEMIYNSLSLKDDDLIDRAERRDFPVLRPENPIISVSVRDKIQNFFAETVNSKNYEPTSLVEHQRAIPLRRSGVPDKMTDDMAFRRMNQKDRGEVKKLPSQSYLPSSPALFSVQNISPIFRKESLALEPDIMYDDVMFRNIRHANSTLKIQDPQPPFGIPIGLITPAPDSDYLHATPTERYRPTFVSSKTPDIVKDDLAFRNLRKDRKPSICLGSNKSEVKKRAVRSLSANLYSVMQRDSPRIISMEKTSNIAYDKNREKTLSLTDLTEAKHILETRLKELKEEKNAKRAEFFELSQEDNKNGPADLAGWSDLTDLNGNFKTDPPIKFQKTSFLLDDRSKFRTPIVELSKFPAAAPSFSLQNNPFKEFSSVDDDQLENLLSALAKEAENASKDIKRQLDQLETKKESVQSKNTYDTSEILKAQAKEEFCKKFKALDNTKKRRRNLSLSSTSELKEDVLKTGSLERRKKNDKSEFIFAEVLRNNMNETTSVSRAVEINEQAKLDLARFKTEGELSKAVATCSSDCRDQRRSQNFEVVLDLSDILKDVEVESHLNREVTLKETNVFQEVYEYNCKLSPPESRRGEDDEEDLGAIEKVSQIPRMISDIEMEFEKLHQEVNSTKKTKEIEFALVDDLIADITSVDQPPSDFCSSFPFPKGNEEPSSSKAVRPKNRTCPRSSEGEGLGLA